MKYTSRLTAVACVLLLFVLPSQSPAQTGWSKSFEHAVVVTAEQRASQAGRDILQQGGNAVDAAVAVQFALAVTLPRAGNIGGGGFMVVRLTDGSSRALDFREQAPLQAHKDMYMREGEYVTRLSRKGGLASGVPGVVDGMVKAMEQYGNLSLNQVIQPAIELARKGYRLSYRQAEALNDNKKGL
ncbi:gamma-glutamyltransferase, partial [Fodinibius sp.]|uniref:gamma-glutamyltransferase n=1 Tax=Fodinibius sp. TaxID=1872440 RepID=UPI003566C6F2